MGKSKYESKIENDEYDKEIESIHEQGEQLKQYGVYAKDLSTKESNECEEPTAEDLKSLATSVSEVLQPDGSIVKEYILNDPKIIEQIRKNIKSESFASRDATAPASKNSNQMIQNSYNLMDRYGGQDQQQICAKVEYLLLFIVYFGKSVDIRVSSAVYFLLDFDRIYVPFNSIVCRNCAEFCPKICFPF